MAKIIEITPDGQYKLNDQLLKSIALKAKNCNNFALISIIGQKFSSKTLLMNCLKSYLETKCKTNWPKNHTFKYEEGFHTDTTDLSMSPVIHMWSEPFILENEDQKTAVFLMDSSHVFNDSTEISNTKLVEDTIGLFLNTSSTVIHLSESVISVRL